MPKLIIKSGNDSGREIDLQNGLVRIGRDPSNDIQLNEPSVSSFHCELHVAEIGVSVHDLGSTNGTFINQRPIKKGMLQRGDLLTLGDVDLATELPEVNIVLPEIKFEGSAGAAFLADGTPACFAHRVSAALFRCTKCDQWWCGDCVRALKRLNGSFLRFCPECSGTCATIAQQPVARKRKFFGSLGRLGRLRETLRIPRKK